MKELYFGDLPYPAQKEFVRFIDDNNIKFKRVKGRFLKAKIKLKHKNKPPTKIPPPPPPQKNPNN